MVDVLFAAAIGARVIGVIVVCLAVFMYSTSVRIHPTRYADWMQLVALVLAGVLIFFMPDIAVGIVSPC